MELDAITGRKLGIEAGSKVAVLLHLNPPEAHTVNIEPLTADDWDILNQHAEFLELNFLSQVRVVPNPVSATDGAAPQPIVLHLTATSTVAVKVVSIEPQPAQSQQFLKVAPEAEIIVAPKARQSQGRSGKESHSVASAGRKSAAGRSSTSTARHRATRDESLRERPVFLRPLDRAICTEWMDTKGSHSTDEGLRIWLDSSLLRRSPLKGVAMVSVSIVSTAGLEEPSNPQSQTPEQDRPASAVVARLLHWEDAPDNQHALLSSMLACSLGAAGTVGGLIRIEPAPSQLPRTASIMKQLQADTTKPGSKEVVVKTLRITPFLESTSTTSTFSFGGQSKVDQEKAVQRIVALFGRSDDEHSLFHGPLTHKMILPAEKATGRDNTWPGGLLRFDPVAPQTAGGSSVMVQWLIGSDRKLPIEVQPAVAKPLELTRESVGSELPPEPEVLVGVDAILSQVKTSLRHDSSILLTGGLGAGKTAIVSNVLHALRAEDFFHVSYYPCRKLITDETRLSTIKETLNRLFAKAAWGARLDGRSLVILDDLDRLCPVETELQVGNDNSRSRQISELLSSIVRKYCTRESGVVLLATAQGKEALNNVVVSGHVVRDIVSIKAPNKDGRRKMLEQIVRQKTKAGHRPLTALEHSHEEESHEHPWMDGSEESRPPSVNGDTHVAFDDTLDFLDIAGKTDGYHAGDLGLLVSRARSESLIRAFNEGMSSNSSLPLSDVDFTAALKGFTPASLRNVTLQSSTTSFSSIGGLRETRQTLLETLQYPTTYAPIFAKCPLRLRSGLLLYGYPGCGKTLLASAVAGECGLNFISVKGPEILNKYIGASEKSVRDLFDRAEAARPCVLFFDEFDSIAPKRGHDSTGVTDRVVNQLLTQMDGAEGLSGVYVLAATSRPDLIDPALLRPGRLDKSLLCDMPDLDDRLDILRAVSGKLKLEGRMSEGDGAETLADIARRTEGYSGADLQAVMYNAHLDAIHDVLGADDDMTAALGKKGDGSAKERASGRDFTFFRMQDAETNGDAASHRTDSGYLAEKAQIAARLAAMDLAKRRAREQRHGMDGHTAGLQDKAQVEDKTKTPTIVWRHVAKSLKETRPSLSAQERNRLGRVYKEFVVGRSGDLKDGEQGTEVGGRTSLM